MAVILLHGFTNTGRSWDPVIAALQERYTALAPDIRGHGTAAGHEPVALEAVIEDVAEAGGAAFTLCGYSMGGRIALHAALALPDRVNRLVLIGASPGIADEIERLDIEELAERWESIAVQVLSGQPAAVREAARRDRLRNTPRGLAQALRGLGTGALPPVWERLGELPMPVMLVVGERDIKFRTIAEEMAETIPDAQVVVVPDAGHAVHLEAPAAVAQAIAAS